MLTRLGARLPSGSERERREDAKEHFPAHEQDQGQGAGGRGRPVARQARLSGDRGADGDTRDLRPLERHFYTTSACGVCGKESLEQLELRGCPVIPPGPEIAAETIYSLPAKLRGAQGLFEATGGLHAAALFDAEGNLLALREDVGRHNATDKLVGWALLEGRLPLSDHIIMVSGRSSFEIMQKCLAAGVPIVCAISAPSSLAVDVARRFDMTLVGFLRGNRFNVYSGHERVQART